MTREEEINEMIDDLVELGLLVILDELPAPTPCPESGEISDT